MTALGRVADGEQALVNEAPTGLHPSGFDPSRTCLTPETYYRVSQDSDRTLVVRLTFPFDIGDWVRGNYAISETAEGVDPTSDADRVRRYEEREAGRRRVVDLIHDRMESVGADCYRVTKEIDALIGEDRVDYGIRHARWRRDRNGGRPAPMFSKRFPVDAQGIAARSGETGTGSTEGKSPVAEGEAPNTSSTSSTTPPSQPGMNRGHGDRS